MGYTSLFVIKFWRVKSCIQYKTSLIAQISFNKKGRSKRSLSRTWHTVNGQLLSNLAIFSFLVRLPNFLSFLYHSRPSTIVYSVRRISAIESYPLCYLNYRHHFTALTRPYTNKLHIAWWVLFCAIYNSNNITDSKQLHWSHQLHI